MSAPQASIPSTIPAGVFPRLIDEGHTPSAWYGTNIVTAIEEVDAAAAARRPQPGRHNIGEIAIHHAYWLHEVRARLTGTRTPFALEGEDWFEWDGGSALPWAEVQTILRQEVEGLRKDVEAIEERGRNSPLPRAGRFEQVLGIAGQGAYHSGQIQLLMLLVA